jgi:hypothetical protein
LLDTLNSTFTTVAGRSTLCVSGLSPVLAACLLGSGSQELRVEHLPESDRVSLRFEPRADRVAQLRVVEWALWRTRDHVGNAAELIGASRNTVSALRAELRGRENVSDGGGAGDAGDRRQPAAS